MKMSVMFITCNRKSNLIKAIESCVKNRMDEMEIVIVDNNSTDGTQAEVERYLKDKQMPYRYYYSEKNLGVSGGRNLAFEMCGGEYVFCLDDDAIIETEDFFEKVYFKMKSKQDVVAAAIEIYEPENEKYLKSYIYERSGVLYAHSYIGAAHILKRDIFVGRKLYPAKLEFGSEEAYVAYRIWGMGKRMLYLDNVRVLHMPSIVGRVYGDERKLNIIINNYITRKLCYPRILSPLLYFTFICRILKNNLLRGRNFRVVKRIIKERYDDSESDRMSLRAFFKMTRNVRINWVI